MSTHVQMSDVAKEIKDSQVANYHRGRSWKHCYAFFRKHKNNIEGDDALLDQAALHLGFFLASWGMFHNSFLLQVDYKYYRPIILKLTEKKYGALWNASWNTKHFNYEKQKEEIDLLFQFKSELEVLMKKENCHDHKGPTETLVTKIIMATMGCVPAYDRYFKTGLRDFLKEKGIKQGSNFSRRSFEKLLGFCRTDDTLREIYNLPIPTIYPGIQYPPMKILDLYVWLLGAKSEK